MNVLMLAQFYPPDIGGEERHVANLSRALVDVGHDVRVITSQLPTTQAGISVEDGVTVQRVETSAQRVPGLHSSLQRPHALPFPDPSMTRAIAHALQEGMFDVVHAHNWIVNSAVIPARSHRTPLVLTLHDYSHVCAVKRLVRDGTQCVGPGVGRCLLCAARHYGIGVGPATATVNVGMRYVREANVAAFIAVSRSVARRNRLIESGVRYEIIPNFVPDELVELDVPPPADGPLLFVGDLMADKGVNVLLDAYGAMDPRPPLLLVGRPTGLSLSLPTGTTLLAPRPHDEVMAIMRTARAVIVPSLVADSCPTVVIEAMALGKPIVAARSGGIIDLVKDEVSGLLVTPGDSDELRKALERIVGDEGLTTRLSSGASANVRPFTASAVRARIERLYESVAGEQAPKRVAAHA